MSLVGPDLAASWPGGRSAAAVPGPRHRLRRRRALLTAAGVLVATPVVVLLATAAVYQPLGYGNGGITNLAYPGLPAAVGARTVNTVGDVRQDVYIPPQRKGYTFYLFANIANEGSRAVTIESVALPPGSALTPAGKVRFAFPPDRGYGAPAIPPARHVLHPLTLGPGGDLLVAIPVRSWPCWPKYGGFEAVPAFNVTYRFGFFTHTITLPWGQLHNELILHAPFGRPGQPDVVCIGGS